MHRLPGPQGGGGGGCSVQELAQGLTTQGGSGHSPCGRGVQFPAREWDFHSARELMQRLDVLDTDACVQRRRA